MIKSEKYFKLKVESVIRNVEIRKAENITALTHKNLIENIPLRFIKTETAKSKKVKIKILLLKLITEVISLVTIEMDKNNPRITEFVFIIRLSSIFFSLFQNFFSNIQTVKCLAGDFLFFIFT